MRQKRDEKRRPWFEDGLPAIQVRYLSWSEIHFLCDDELHTSKAGRSIRSDSNIFGYSFHFIDSSHTLVHVRSLGIRRTSSIPDKFYSFSKIPNHSKLLWRSHRNGRKNFKVSSAASASSWIGTIFDVAVRVSMTVEHKVQSWKENALGWN